MYFFGEILSFIFRLKNKIISSRKRNIIFPNNTRTIIFQGNFFWKGHLFRTSGKRKYDCTCIVSTALEYSRLLLGNFWSKNSFQKQFSCAFYTLLNPTRAVLDRLLNV